ncbi:hypothetical protein [Salinibacter ruber]|uniref:hypothetical protein n=1 Tax=Salinibacter ruber TaxID=146919 RepID=UPI002072B8F8|nr:hypothetical protein [Salinibacter ruber]
MTDSSAIDDRSTGENSETPLDPHVPSASPIRRVVGYGVAGALGGRVFALTQHLGSSFLAEPGLARWVILYALLGGLGVALWREATRWATGRGSLSRRGAVLVSSLVAGMVLGAATLLVAALKQGAGAGGGLLLLGLPWKDGLGGFVGGAVYGALSTHFDV